MLYIFRSMRGENPQSEIYHDGLDIAVLEIENPLLASIDRYSYTHRIINHIKNL